MSPYEKAKAVYESEYCARTFEEDLELHLRYGYVFSTETEFLMGRPVLKGAPYRDVVNPAHRFPVHDTWLVYLFAGNPTAIIKYQPYPLPWVGFERNNVLRYWPLTKFNEKLGYDYFKNGCIDALSQGRRWSSTEAAAPAGADNCS